MQRLHLRHEHLLAHRRPIRPIIGRQVAAHSAAHSPRRAKARQNTATRFQAFAVVVAVVAAVLSNPRQSNSEAAPGCNCRTGYR